MFVFQVFSGYSWYSRVFQQVFLVFQVFHRYCGLATDLFKNIASNFQIPAIKIALKHN